jgi:hypothetical protein
MKFENLEKLLKYIITENIDLAHSEVEFKSSIVEAIEDEPVTVSTKVTIDCLSESPIINVVYGSDNVLYVDSYESLKNACGSGKISLLGKEIMTNLCEMDNEAHVTLPINFEDGTKNIEFKLAISCNDGEIIQLAKNNEL